VSPALLFAVATAIWGSTWLAIKFQLDVVAPQVSVAYRFALAAAVLGAACVASGRSLAFAPRAHCWLALQGVTMFGLNYIAVYEAERFVASGLVAVVFSTIVFLSPIGMRLAFGTPIRNRVLVGGTLGVAGVVMLFLPELRAVAEGGNAALGIGYALASTAIAAGGNLVTVRMQRDALPVFPSTAWGMAYGALCSAIVATFAGVPWTFDARLPYVASLAYLAVVGSVVAFGAYFLLLKKAGVATASFVGVSTPVVAMVLTTAFENYRWTWIAAAGVVLAVAGNVVALRAPAARRESSAHPSVRAGR
jgi:drug/metabolite transporter (DMT)-like permease